MRKRGHTLDHLAQRPPWGWAWQCECGFRELRYAGTKAIARTLHREHKERIGTPAEHAKFCIESVGGHLTARCICGVGLGESTSMESTGEAHRAHRADVEVGGHDRG